ncbi:ADP-ribosylation factor GTPase-activating protein [Seminavis robusta]|uniref:ADP-ribosylation factor GTPase-activating protein n=1 Tax=Seminavis robusta TaxID=568900 RepID=A0A9N8HP44_9STRA|nr:ADP-ribosylation factor GTPase-activating protein [Seminavis robusta]|eukprot:Sro1143_g245970.1 ADP-ribosylation factor GTPase-activating protein (394) ;mRNA; r:14616-15797
MSSSSSTLQDAAASATVRSALSPPPQPWGTKLLDLSRLASPRTWWGVAMNVRRSPFVDIDWHPFLQGLLGVLVPFLVLLILLRTTTTTIGTTATVPRPPALLYFGSPWAYHCLWVSMSKPLRELVGVGVNVWKGRSVPLPDAFETLTSSVAQSRCIRKRRYDLYLPPPTSTTLPKQTDHDTEHQQTAILFLPGSGVSHAAYANAAARLSDAGYVVVVPSMEPLRLALPHLGADWWDIARILRRVQRQLGGHCHWVLAGHSMGSFAAMNLWAEYYDASSSRQSSFSIGPELVLWGVANFPTYMPSSNMTETTQLLLVQGQDDLLLKMTEQWKDLQEAKLPTNCQRVSIPGGTHGGFGSYPSEALPPGDLPHTKQQQLAVEATVQFLKNRQEGSR